MRERNEFQIATDNTKILAFRKTIQQVFDEARRSLDCELAAAELIEFAAELQASQLRPNLLWIPAALARVDESRVGALHRRRRLPLSLALSPDNACRFERMRENEQAPLLALRRTLDELTETAESKSIFPTTIADVLLDVALEAQSKDRIFSAGCFEFMLLRLANWQKSQASFATGIRDLS